MHLPQSICAELSAEFGRVAGTAISRNSRLNSIFRSEGGTRTRDTTIMSRVPKPVDSAVFGLSESRDFESDDSVHGGQFLFGRGDADLDALELPEPAFGFDLAFQGAGISARNSSKWLNQTE